MNTLIHQFVEECRAGTCARMICRVSSGWVVLGESQFLRGYALIYPDPVAPDLNALSAEARKTLMYEASVVGDALIEITGALRINYEILGNLAPALHVHVFPRFSDEPADLRARPVWFYDWDSANQFDAKRDTALMKDIQTYLEQAGIAN